VSGPRVRSPSYCEGGAEARTEIREFLRRRQKSIENEEIMEISLHEASKGQAGDVIEEYKLGFDDEALEHVVREMVVDAERNALILRGRIKFAVKISGYAPSLTFGLDVVRPDDLNDEEQDDEDIDDLERPNKAGMVGMAMRHAEHSHKEMRAASRTIRETMRDLRVQLRESQDENRELRTTLRSMFRMEQELHNMDYLRRRDMRREEKSEERRDKLISGVEKMLPAVGARLLGADPSAIAQVVAQAHSGNSPQSSAHSQVEGWTAIERRSSTIIDHLQKLDGDKQTALLQILPQELLMEIQALHQEVQEKKKSPPSSVHSQGGTNGVNGSASAYG